MFVQESDFKNKIHYNALQQILDGDTEKLDDAEAIAAAMVTDRLTKYYDLGAEWGKTGRDRNRRLLKWMIDLMAYYLYEGIADDDVPERIIKDYDDTLKELTRIEDGKTDADLPRRIKEETQRPKTKFRWGSQPKRSHNW